jgi:hypothetical protein
VLIILGLLAWAFFLKKKTRQVEPKYISDCNFAPAHNGTGLHELNACEMQVEECPEARYETPELEGSFARHELDAAHS